MADWADKQVECLGRQGFLRADPLKGMCIETEYKLVKAEISKWRPEIQALIVQRWELGK